jgi:syndecan 1
MSADHGDNAGPGRPLSDGEPGAPRFDVVVRGYDRRQVDEHIAGLERTISRQRTDLDQTGRNGSAGPRADSRSGAGLFGPTGRAGSPAADAAGGLTPEMISAFTTRLQSILQAAEEEAEEVRSNARTFARKEEDAGRARLAELDRRRESMLADLSRVRSQLDGLLNTATKEPAIGAGLPPAPATPPDGLPLRGDKGGPAPTKRADQPAPRMGQVSVSDTGRTRVVGPHPDGQGRGLPNRAPVPGTSAPGGPQSQGGPGQNGPGSGGSGTGGPGSSGPSVKPRPTPSPRPRANPPSPGVPGAPGGSQAAAGRGPNDQHSRNGALNGRGDDPDAGRAYGSGAR